MLRLYIFSSPADPQFQEYQVAQVGQSHPINNKWCQNKHSCQTEAVFCRLFILNPPFLRPFPPLPCLPCGLCGPVQSVSKTRINANCVCSSRENEHHISHRQNQETPHCDCTHLESWHTGSSRWARGADGRALQRTETKHWVLAICCLHAAHWALWLRLTRRSPVKSWRVPGRPWQSKIAS